MTSLAALLIVMSRSWVRVSFEGSTDPNPLTNTRCCWTPLLGDQGQDQSLSELEGQWGEERFYYQGVGAALRPLLPLCQRE